ncbi:MAG: catalase [Candidatus Cloacimonetes bacterium]|nr:catalase [Candidatus Cloacimonadota bacterium]
MLMKIIKVSVVSALVFASTSHGQNDKNSLYNFDLYKNEKYFGGSKEAELEQFAKGSQIILNGQKVLAKKNLRPRRVFHAKQHGCVTGRLTTIADRPLDKDRATYKGLFEEDQSFDVLARFSNGLGLIDHDKKPDFRGMAIKVIDAQENKNADFLLINIPVGIAKDAEQFLDFTQKVVKHGAIVGTSIYATLNPRAGVGVIKATGLLPYKVKSLATIHYWGGHPYLLGPDRAMKMVVIPTESKEDSVRSLIGKGKNFLKVDLQDRLEKGPMTFKIGLQLDMDEKSTPIEDNVDRWTEKESPVIHVANLVFEQQNIKTLVHEQTCEYARFSPGNYHSDHRPLSNLGRARILTYQASQVGRNANTKKISKDDIKLMRTKSIEKLQK